MPAETSPVRFLFEVFSTEAVWTRGGVSGLPGDGERGGPGSDQVKLLMTAGACAQIA